MKETKEKKPRRKNLPSGKNAISEIISLTQKEDYSLEYKHPYTLYVIYKKQSFFSFLYNFCKGSNNA